MSNEELPSSANELKISHWQNWIGPTILGLIIAKLFGVVGGLVIIGSYYWLKPKYGAWMALAASSVAGVIFALGVGFIFENRVATPIPSTENATPSQVPVFAAHQEQQHALQTAVIEIVAQYPQLDPESPKLDQSAIDYVVGKRDAYVANGYAIDIALRMAVNDYGEQLALSRQREVEQQFAQQITSHRFNQPSGSQVQPVTNDYIRRKNEPCQPKDIMTDDEISRCRSR